MLKLTYKLLFLFALIVAIKMAGQLIVKRSEKKAMFDAKMEVANQDHEINTMFIGTSRIMYGLKPEIIDSLNGGEVRSFNLGIPKMTMPYSVDWLEESLNNSNLNLKTIIIEVNYTNLEYGGFIRGLEFYYEQNLSDVVPLWHLVYDNISRNYLRYLSLKSELNAILYLLVDQRSQVVSRLSFDSTGYIKRIGKIPGLRIRHQNIYRQTSKVYHDALDLGMDLGLYKNLIEHFNSRGIEVLFMLPPLAGGIHGSFSAKVYKSLPEERRLSIDTTALYSIIRDKSMMHDGVHFNDKGATLYSLLVGESIRERLNLP